MQQVTMQRKAPVRDRWDRYAVLPLDPRDPDILRAKAASAMVPARPAAGAEVRSD